MDRAVGQAPLADAVREMLFAALFSSKRFTILEKCDTADATLKGAVIESAKRGARAESEGIGFGAVAGGILQPWPCVGRIRRRGGQQWRGSCLLGNTPSELGHFALGRR